MSKIESVFKFEIGQTLKLDIKSISSGDYKFTILNNNDTELYDNKDNLEVLSVNQKHKTVTIGRIK